MGMRRRVSAAIGIHVANLGGANDVDEATERAVLRNSGQASLRERKRSPEVFREESVARDWAPGRMQLSA